MAPKIALCFLATKDIVHWDVWSDWLRGNERKVAVYAHYSPKHAKNITQAVLRHHRVPRCINTRWGDASLVRAEGLLYAHALRNPQVRCMVLLSPSDVPVRSFAYTYARLMRSRKSYVSFMQTKEGRSTDSSGCTTFIRKRRCAALVDRYVDGRPCETISQWKVLQRSDAKRFVAMTRDRGFMRLFSNPCIELRPSGQAPDEIMFPLWINHLYHKKGSRRTVFGHFIDANTTYIEFKGKRFWSPTKNRYYVRTAPHPVQIRGIGRARRREICEEQCMFMRKVDTAHTGRLRSTLPLMCR